MTEPSAARDRAIGVIVGALRHEFYDLESDDRFAAAGAITNALLAHPEVLRALDGPTVREWGACDIADDPDDPDKGDGVDPAGDEDDAHKIAASWSSGRVCWRDVTYGPWRTG